MKEKKTSECSEDLSFHVIDFTSVVGKSMSDTGGASTSGVPFLGRSDRIFENLFKKGHNKLQPIHHRATPKRKGIEKISWPIAPPNSTLVPMTTRLPDVHSVRTFLQSCPRPLALVPTMGALHEGHLQLIRAAREKVGASGTVAVSIFVNPIQFDRAEDLQNYPKPLDDDLTLCEKEGVDLAFTPEIPGLYPPDHSTLVTESLLTKHLCGATRPGHFDGVLTIVLKLFNIFQPELAIFGNKDFQQLALIRRMVRDLDVPIEIIGHPTVRESDGLALSSRNRKLAAEHRADAPRIRRALLAARDLAKNGEQSPAVYLDAARHHLLKQAPSAFKIDYLELVDAISLQPVAKVTAPVTLATACFYGPVRLIDNIGISPA